MRPDEGWMIVASTIVVDLARLPQRLSPVCAKRNTQDKIFIPQGYGDDDSPWNLEDREWLEEMVRVGDACWIEPSIPFRPGHALIQMAPLCSPELVQIGELDERMQRAVETALVDLAEALRDEDICSAERRLWFAVRADGGRHSGLRLLVLAMRRAAMSTERQRYLEAQLEPPEIRQEVRDQLLLWGKDNRFAAVLALLRLDPFAARLLQVSSAAIPVPLPSYLEPHKQFASWSIAQQRCTYGAISPC